MVLYFCLRSWNLELEMMSHSSWHLKWDWKVRWTCLLLSVPKLANSPCAILSVQLWMTHKQTMWLLKSIMHDFHSMFLLYLQRKSLYCLSDIHRQHQLWWFLAKQTLFSSYWYCPKTCFSSRNAWKNETKLLLPENWHFLTKICIWITKL